MRHRAEVQWAGVVVPLARVGVTVELATLPHDDPVQVATVDRTTRIVMDDSMPHWLRLRLVRFVSYLVWHDQKAAPLSPGATRLVLRMILRHSGWHALDAARAHSSRASLHAA